MYKIDIVHWGGIKEESDVIHNARIRKLQSDRPECVHYPVFGHLQLESLYPYQHKQHTNALCFGTNRWRGWLTHLVTSRKVAGSIPNGVTAIFRWLNPSGRTMTLGSTQTSNRNGYDWYLLGGKGGRCVALTSLTPQCADCLEIWEPKHPGTLLVCPGLYRDCFTLR
jgi:hypothetical protein